MNPFIKIAKDLVKFVEENELEEIVKPEESKNQDKEE